MKDKARLSPQPATDLQARTVQISKAPEPITPLAGRGSYHPPAKPPASSIEWRDWRLMGMEPWQASALTMGIDPKNIQPRLKGGMYSSVVYEANFPSQDIEAEFSKRTAEIEANLHDKAHFGKYFEAVSLPELAAWCVYAGYENVPPGLFAMAAPPAPVATQAKATTDLGPETIEPPAPVKMTAQPLTMSKAGMVKAHAHHWPTIQADMSESVRNGLSVAKAGARGWSESLALEWARAKGKLTGQSSASKQPAPADPMAAHFGQLAALPSRKHTL